jgi:hypothetical protein
MWESRAEIKQDDIEVFEKYMIYLWSVHLNGVRQTFWGQEHFQANITIITYLKKNLIDFYTTTINT